MVGDSYTTSFAHSSHLYRALAELPILPKQSQFQFFAYDVELPKTVEGEERYIELCREKQVLPYTMFSWMYDAKNKKSVQWLEQILPRWERNGGVERSIVDAMLCGGKSHQVKLELGEIKEVEMLQHIAEHILPDLTAQKYVLHSADIWLTQYRMCQDAYGRGTAVAVRNNSSLEMKLELALPISDVERERLMEWFLRVKK